MNSRPKVKVRPYVWKALDETETQGIGILSQGRAVAHYTAAEARTMADRLHDLADKLEQHEGEIA